MGFCETGCEVQGPTLAKNRLQHWNLQNSTPVNREMFAAWKSGSLEVTTRSEKPHPKRNYYSLFLQSWCLQAARLVSPALLSIQFLPGWPDAWLCCSVHGQQRGGVPLRLHFQSTCIFRSRDLLEGKKHTSTYEGSKLALRNSNPLSSRGPSMPASTAQAASFFGRRCHVGQTWGQYRMETRQVSLLRVPSCSENLKDWSSLAAFWNLGTCVRDLKLKNRFQNLKKSKGWVQVSCHSILSRMCKLHNMRDTHGPQRQPEEAGGAKCQVCQVLSKAAADDWQRQKFHTQLFLPHSFPCASSASDRVQNWSRLIKDGVRDDEPLEESSHNMEGKPSPCSLPSTDQTATDPFLSHRGGPRVCNSLRMEALKRALWAEEVPKVNSRSYLGKLCSWKAHESGTPRNWVTSFHAYNHHILHTLQIMTAGTRNMFVILLPSWSQSLGFQFKMSVPVRGSARSRYGSHLSLCCEHQDEWVIESDLPRAPGIHFEQNPFFGQTYLPQRNDFTPIPHPLDFQGRGKACLYIYIYIYTYDVGSITWPHFSHFRVNNLAAYKSITCPPFFL